MQWFANMKTALKLTIGFGLGLVLLLSVGGMAFSGMSRMDKATENLITDPIPGLLYRPTCWMTASSSACSSSGTSWRPEKRVCAT